MERIKIGVIGCGNICSIYFKNLTRVFTNTEVVACADLIPERARAKAEEFGIPRVLTVPEILANPEIQIIVNLTIPKAHAEICLAALEACNHVYAEKPLAVNRADGKKIMDAATARGLMVGCAPDTFMGGGLQTCRKLIDDGVIGTPVGATAFMLCHGHESWHPDPEFYYQVGGGPMLDMGPYYLTALISMLGPVARVSGSTRISFPERQITSEPKNGQIIRVEVPTHITGVLDFQNGAVGMIITSFDIWHSQLPRIEIYGSEGTLSVPDPNTFGGPVYLRRKEEKEWQEVPLTHTYSENSRGYGVSDMANALVTGEKHRANGEMAYHVLDVMEGIHDASREGKYYELKSTCLRPAPLPVL